MSHLCGRSTCFRRLVLALIALAWAHAPGCRAGSAPLHATAAPLAIQPGEPRPVGFPQYPSLSPDGTVIVFGWAGDLWSITTNGGIATQLTSHPAEDRRSAFSADGRWLAFESNREGARNLYVAPVYWTPAESGRMTLGPVVRITNSDQPQGLGGFTADGQALLFASTREPSVYRAPRLYRVELRFASPNELIGGGAVSRVSGAFGNSPRASSDGSSIFFTRGYAGLERPAYRGSGNQELVRTDLASGSFTPVAADSANDTDGWPLPDGSVVFVSSRDGQNNVWRVDGAGRATASRPTQLTRFAPTPEQLTIGHGVRDLTVSADGRLAAFAVWDTLYTLDLTQPGASPQALAIRAGADSAQLDFQRLNLDKDVSEHVISPDGKTLAVVARGEIFVRNTQEGHPTRRVTETVGRERDIAWSPDGRVLYFSSDDAGAATPAGSPPGVYGLYIASVDLAREDITPPTPEKKVADAGAKKDEPATPDAAADPAKVDSPAAEAKPETAKSDKKPEKKPDHGKRWSEALRFKLESVVAPDAATRDNARTPTPSPDGKKLLYVRGRGDLVLRELESKAERTLLKGWDEPEALWASDSRHIVYAVSDLDYNSDIWLMDTAAPSESGDLTDKRRWSNPVNLTRHPDSDSSPRLSADGKVLAFLSERAGENGELDVWVVNLDRAIDAMTTYERDEYFKKAGESAAKRKPLGAPDKPEKSDKPAEGAKEDGAGGDKPAEEKKSAAEKPATPPQPLEFDAEDAYLRVRRLTSLPGAETGLAMTPGGDRVVFVGASESERSLMSVDHKGTDRKVLQAGPAGNTRMSLTGDKVSFLRTGVVSVTNPKTGGKVDALPIDAPVTIDIARQQRQKFIEASRIIGEVFYHPTLKGLDWDGLTARYLSLAERTRTSDEFNRVTMLLFGELNGSHLGIGGGGGGGGAGAPPVATGYLGVFSSAAPGGFRVDYVAVGTPADAKPSRLEVGDVIVAIDGRRLAPHDTSMPTLDLDAAMAGKAGKETIVEVRRAAPADPARPVQTLLLTPLGSGAWDDLEYRDEIVRRQRKVDELSQGRLGYLHIRSMGEASVRDFERDLYAAAGGKQGLIIDVRDNGGGSTADILLSALTAPNHAFTAPRGVDLKDVPRDAYPRDRRLIYAWTRPINVLINQNSFSNAEIFAHAIKTSGRGKLIGTATFGGVISTGAASLIDGTTIRTPGRGWYLPDGRDMENNGAQPDVDVSQTPEDEAAQGGGRDRQLEAAVTELLQRVGR